MENHLSLDNVRILLAEHFTTEYKIEELKLWHNRPKTIVYRFYLNGVESKYCYLKIYKSRKSSQTALKEYSVLDSLTKAFLGHDDIGVVNPIAYLPSDDAFISEEFVGEDLYSFFKKSCQYNSQLEIFEEAKSAIDKLVHWVDIYQAADLGELSEDYSAENLLRNTFADIDLAVGNNILLESFGHTSKMIIEKLAQHASNWNNELSNSNADTKLWNFLCSRGGAIRALDFVAVGRGLPAMDIARLWVGLNWLKIFPLVKNSSVSQLQRRLLATAYSRKMLEPDQFDFGRLCVFWELAAFYSNIRNDKYRRKLRNRLFFPLIERYFHNTMLEILREVDLKFVQQKQRAKKGSESFQYTD